MRAQVGPKLWELVVCGILATDKKACAAQLLRIEEVNLPRIEALAIEAVADDHEVGPVEAIGRFAEAKARLFVKRGIVAKPDDNSAGIGIEVALRSEEHTSELQSLMRISYAVFCLKKKNTH